MLQIFILYTPSKSPPAKAGQALPAGATLRRNLNNSMMLLNMEVLNNFAMIFIMDIC